MPYQSDEDRGLFGRPGRLAAVGAAVTVCALSISGALGLSISSDPAHAAQSHHQTRPSGAATSGAAASIQTPDTEQSAPPAGTGTHPASGQSPASTPPADGRGVSQTVPLPARSGQGKRIVFDMTAQRVWLVDDHNTVTRTYPVSGSKYDNLQPGSYTVSSRSRYATAYNSSETLNFMVRFAFGRTAPIGFHAIPVRPDGTLVEPRSGLGKPASDGCIRQWISDARALWQFAPVGTPVVVLA